MLWKRKPKPVEPTPDAHDAQRRETMAQLRERIASREELSPETLDATVRYIRENHDDFDGIVTLARAAAQTLDVNFGDPDTQRERIVHEALSSQRDPDRLDRLTRTLLHDALRSYDMPGVLVRYWETHPERHPWEKTIRDFIVKDLPRAQRAHAQEYGVYPENPFPGVVRLMRALKEAPALHHAMGAYARAFDDWSFSPDLVSFAEQLREDYPDDLPSATALLAMMASRMDRGWQPPEVYRAFTRLHDKFGDALMDEVVRACDSFLLPLPSVLGLGLGESGTSDALPIARRVAQWLKGVRPEDSGYESGRYDSGYRFLRNLAQTPVGAAAYMALLTETPEENARAKLLASLQIAIGKIAKSGAVSASVAAGIVDMYRRGLIPPQSVVERESQSVLAMTLLEEGASYFVDSSAFQPTRDDAPNGSRPLMAYLATTPLGANGQYDSEASERLLWEILGRTEWIDAIMSDFDRALDVEEGKRIVNGWLLPALMAYPSHAPHAVEWFKQRLQTAKTLDDQAIAVCAFGHLCQRLHEHRLGDEWVMPRRKALERRLRGLRPAILGRAQQILHALDAQLGDIHNTQTLTTVAYESLAEMRDAVNTAIDAMASSAIHDFDDRFRPVSTIAKVLRAPMGVLDDHALQRDFAERAAREIAARLCS